MPRRLLHRIGPDSIAEFRNAAQERYQDGVALAIAGQRTGAIYLWGYVAEMTLKAAYFTFLQFPANQSLHMRPHLRDAIDRGRQTFNIAWPPQGDGHNVRAWAELLVAERAVAPQGAYSTNFAIELQRRGQRIEPLWREILRYRKNLAYVYEVNQVQEAVEWLLGNSHQL
ncbi:hypothetical protein NA78x_001290 [Anatilimnocola sp. NA78]|uniref:hypothetical protein n=1 Tax=Anatilimnocola sp. NA78 TaxID=3415683 RepID=UPI003CE4B60D